MILSTPFTVSGAVDWEDLAREAEFVDRCGAHGMVWPQGSSGVAFLSKDERLRGMELLAKTMRGRRAVLGLGVRLSGRVNGRFLAVRRRPPAQQFELQIEMLQLLRRRPVPTQSHVWPLRGLTGLRPVTGPGL